MVIYVPSWWRRSRHSEYIYFGLNVCLCVVCVVLFMHSRTCNRKQVDNARWLHCQVEQPDVWRMNWPHFHLSILWVLWTQRQNTRNGQYVNSENRAMVEADKIDWDLRANITWWIALCTVMHLIYLDDLYITYTIHIYNTYICMLHNTYSRCDITHLSKKYIQHYEVTMKHSRCSS